MLYAASSLSLACLEILVHIRNPNNFPEYSFSKLSLDENEIRKWAESALRTQAVIKSEILFRESGDEWIDGRKWIQRRMAPIALPVKQVPSIVIPQEWNYLIDPEMPKLAERWAAPEPFQIDPRLLNPSLR